METQVAGKLSVQMYALSEIPLLVRVSFELPGDPYDKSKPISDRGIEYLKKLGVFFYRDELHQHGVVIEPDESESPILQRLNFQAYYYQGTLDFDTLKVSEWATVDDAIVSKKGDDKAWLKWGEPTNVLEFDSLSLRKT